MSVARAFSDPPILALTIAQTLSWAGLFYVFPALVLDWQSEFGWTTGAIMGAFSLALVVQGLCARYVGALIDGGLAPYSMPGGAILGAVCLVLLTQTQTLWQFYAIWAVMGLVTGLTLYDAAFALVMRGRPDTARESITAITLVAGFASAITYPLTAIVSDLAGWRVAVLVLAALVLAGNMPLAAYAAKRLGANPRSGAADAAPNASRRKPGFIALTVGLSLTAAGYGIVTSHMLPLMTGLGAVEATAVLAAAIVGPAQVAGRFLMALGGGGRSGVSLATFALSGMGLAAALLLLAGLSPVFALGFAVLHGMSYGLMSILRPVVIREVLAPRNFGAMQGAVLRPAIFTIAASPFVAAMIADALGYVPVVLLCVTVQAAGAIILARLPTR